MQSRRTCLVFENREKDCADSIILEIGESVTGELSGELQTGWWKALQVRPCLSCRKMEECYRQQCRTGSSQTVRATERRSVGERSVCGGGRMGQWKKKEDWRRA